VLNLFGELPFPDILVDKIPQEDHKFPYKDLLKKRVFKQGIENI
jgi:hypothetical protein